MDNERERVSLMVRWALVSVRLHRLENIDNTDTFQEIILHSTTKVKEIISARLKSPFLKSKSYRLNVSSFFVSFLLCIYGNVFNVPSQESCQLDLSVTSTELSCAEAKKPASHQYSTL